MDSAPDQLVDHISRYLKQGLSEDKIRNVLQHNDLAAGMLDEAIATVQATLAAEAAAKAKAKAEAEAEAKAAREAARAKELEAQKLKDAARKKKRLEAKKSVHKPAVHIEHNVDEADELELGAEALPQDTAISLHSYTKKVSKNNEDEELTTSELKLLPLDETKTIAKDAKDTKDDDTGALLKAADELSTDAPADNTQQSSGQTTPSEPTFAQELLGFQQPPLQTGQVIQTPFAANIANQTPFLPAQSSIPAASPYAGVFGANTTDTNKYTLSQALPDSISAARINLATYLATAGMALAVGITTFILTSIAIGKFFALPYSVLLTTPTKIFISIIGSSALYALWAILAIAFGLTVASLALFDSSQKRKTSINAIMAKSFRRVRRVTIATTALLAVAFLPTVVVALIPVIVVALHGAHTLAYAQPTLYLMAFGWAVFIVMRFGLVPYITLFERAAPLKRAMIRSKELLDGSGQWFVAQAMVALAAIALVLALLVHYRPQAITHPLNVILDLVLLLLVLVANGAMVMLYCNRKLFKG